MVPPSPRKGDEDGGLYLRGARGGITSVSPITIVSAPSSDVVPMSYPLDRRRWLMLAYLSALAMLSDWICFALVPVRYIVEDEFEGLRVSVLVTTFLAANVLGNLIEPKIVLERGLRSGVVLGAVLMAIGSLLRAGLGWGVHPWSLIAGTWLVGLAQPLFHCTPSLLAASWFGPDERSMATAVSLNFNQVGVALAYLVGGNFVGSKDAVGAYCQFLYIASLLLAVGVYLHFEDAPPVPPSRSAILAAQDSAALRRGDGGWKGIDYLTVLKGISLQPGFPQTVTAFTAATIMGNVISAILDAMLHPILGSGMLTALVGAGFQFAFILGSVVTCIWVDRWKHFFSATLMCYGGAALSFLVFLSCTAVNSAVFASLALVVVGLFCGPIEPLAAEIAVEVAYPADENIIIAVLQLIANFASAAALPIVEALSDSDSGYSKGILFLIVVLAVCMIHFSFFSGAYWRLAHDLSSSDVREEEDNGNKRISSFQSFLTSIGSDEEGPLQH